MSLLNKADHILNSLSKDSTQYESFTKIRDRINIEITDKELQLILDKFSKEGLIRSQPIKNRNIATGVVIETNQQSYAITFDGLIMIEEMGGYFNDIQNKKNAKKRKAVNDNLIAYGSLAAFIIATIEIIKIFFGDNFSFFGHFCNCCK